MAAATVSGDMGYPELVCNEDHNTGLQELEPADLEIFRREVELSGEGDEYS